MAKFVCPYCFDQKDFNQIEFRCLNPRCAPEPDGKKGSYYGIAPPMEQRVFSVSGKLPDRAKCSECREETSILVCPSCHNTLPSTITKDREIIISLIGTRDSGKSIYVTVLIQEFMRHIAPKLKGALSFLTKDDDNEYKQRFYTHLYDKHNRIPQTTSAFAVAGALGANRPLLTKFKLPSKKLFSKVNDEYTFVFFDAAGEDFEDEKVMHVISKYIAHSDGIIFLIDPFSNSTVRRELPEDVVQGASTIEADSVSSPKEVIERVAEIVRFQNKKNGKIKIPVAAAFSKLDAFESLLDNGAALRQPSPHLKEGRFVDQDGAIIDQEIRGLLYAWGEDAFLKSLALNYENAKLFAFSALGSNPSTDGKIKEPVPNRIEDALMWMLRELKIVQ